VIVAQRRTQQERRESTIRKLLDAGTDALIELGYAGATIQAICERAGVSQGGLFRHFASREALMVAVGEDVGREILAHYRREFDKLEGQQDRLRLALSLVRKACRSRRNQAWYELAVASRTSPALRKALQPTAARYFDSIEELGRELMPELVDLLGPTFPVLLDTIVAVFDGEAVRRFMLQSPKVEAQRMALLEALLETMLRSLASRGARS
jgi:AcrR family transcriptional regulator